MTAIVWTPQAVADLEAIHAHIARDSVRAADRQVERLVLCVDVLAEFPRAGRVVPEMGRPEYRERIVGNYRVVYRLREDRAEVLTVHHAARRFDPDSGDF